jgi:adenylate kinase
MRIKNAIVVGHLAPYVIPKSQVKFALILRKNPYKLIPVYKKRKYSKRKAIENTGSEILGVTLYDAVKSFGARNTAQIDTTNLSIKQMTQKALLILKRKSGGDKVDWLEIVAKRKDLSRFFPQ